MSKIDIELLPLLSAIKKVIDTDDDFFNNARVLKELECAFGQFEKTDSYKRLINTESDPFDNADFYACYDSECLHCESPEEAIEEALDMGADEPTDNEPDIRKLAPFVVRAYKRMTFSDVYWQNTADWLAEQVLDSVDEEYADPNSERDSKLIDKLSEMLAPVLKQWANKHYTVWACEKTAEREYSVEDVEAMFHKGKVK